MVNSLICVAFGSLKGLTQSNLGYIWTKLVVLFFFKATICRFFAARGHLFKTKAELYAAVAASASSGQAYEVTQHC